MSTRDTTSDELSSQHHSELLLHNKQRLCCASVHLARMARRRIEPFTKNHGVCVCSCCH